MELLSEDPTYLAGGLGLLALAFLVALRVTQQGRYLVRALIALGLAALVLVVEHFWITDAERIERVVYDLRAAVLASDTEKVLSYLSPDVEFVQSGYSTEGEATRSYIRANLPNTTFDFLRISHLKAEVFPQSRRGTAEFRIISSGTWRGLVTLNFGTTNSDWSLGFEETGPRTWKVSRITPTRIIRGMPVPNGLRSPRPRRQRFELPVPR